MIRYTYIYVNFYNTIETKALLKHKSLQKKTYFLFRVTEVYLKFFDISASLLDIKCNFTQI